MKVPLRYQVTESDCGTVSLLNAFSYLFERKDIPAELVRAIHIYTLDCYDEQGNLGEGGTSREAIKKLTKWITEYSKTNDFNVDCKRFEKEEVTLDLFQHCIKNKGVIFIRCIQSSEHYVIVTNIDKRYIYIFDSYYFNKKYYDRDKAVKIIFGKPFSYNRKVKISRVFSQNHEDFSLGKIENRECVTIYNTKISK